MSKKNYVKIFEEVACGETYRMSDGVNAVVEAVLDHIHDEVIDGCQSAFECRQEIVNYSVRRKVNEL